MAELQKLELKLKRTQEENEYAKEHALMLESQLNQIAIEAEGLRKDLAAKDQIIDFLNGKVEQLTERNAAEVAALKEQLTTAHRETEDIKSQTLQYSRDVAKAHEDTVAYYTVLIEQQRAEHAAEMERERQSVSKSSQSVSGSEVLDRVSQLNDEIRRLKEELGHAETQQRLQKELIESSVPAVSNQKDLEAANKAIKDLKEHSEALEQFSQELQAQNVQLREMIASQHAESTATIESLSAKLTEADIRIVALQNNVTRLEGEATVMAANAKSSINDDNDADTKIAELSAELELAKSSLAVSEASFAALRTSHEELLATERARETKGVDTESTESEKNRLQALEQFSQELQAQNVQLREMITSQHAELTAFIDTLRIEKDSLEAENTNLQIKLTQFDDIKEALSKANTTIEDLQLSIANASATAAATAVAAAENDLMVEEAVQKQVSAMQMASNLEKETLKATISQLKQSADELQKKMNHLEEEAAQLKLKTEALQESHTEEIARIRNEHEAALRSSRSALDMAQQEVQLLRVSKQGESSELEEKLKHLSKIHQDHQAENEKLRGAIETLKGELATGRQLSEVVLSQLLPCVELPAGVGGDNRFQLDALSSVKAASQFIVKQRDQIQEMKQSLQQWSNTYDQARQVNESINSQFKQIWEQHASTKEELALSQMAVSNLENEIQRLRAQESELQNRLIRAESRITDLDSMLSSEKGSATGQAEVVVTLRNDLEHHRVLLVEKDDEIAEVRREHASLIKVLEQFQSAKAKDVEEATQYLVFEIDQLKNEIRSLHTQREGQQDKAEATARELKKELGVKNVAITALQHKLNDLRRALEESMSKLNDDHSIDKRVVSHLLVNYIHSVISRRGDEEDIVRVMSGLLNWDSDMMQRAGLIPGPQNPHTKYGPQGSSHSNSTVAAASTAAAIAGSKAKGFLGGVVKSIWGDPLSRVAAAHDTSVGGVASGRSGSTSSARAEEGAAPPPKTIAEMWVDFLLTKSSEAGDAVPEPEGVLTQQQQNAPSREEVHSPQSVAAMYAQSANSDPSAAVRGYGEYTTVAGAGYQPYHSSFQQQYAQPFLPSNGAGVYYGAFPQSGDLPVGSSPYHGANVSQSNVGRGPSFPN